MATLLYQVVYNSFGSTEKHVEQFAKPTAATKFAAEALRGGAQNLVIDHMENGTWKRQLELEANVARLVAGKAKSVTGVRESARLVDLITAMRPAIKKGTLTADQRNELYLAVMAFGQSLKLQPAPAPAPAPANEVKTPATTIAR